MNEIDISEIISDIKQQMKQIPFRRDGRIIRRNELCPCDSGLKFKRCCMLERKTNNEE